MSNFRFFPTWLWWGLNPRPPDYQADVLSPDHAAPPPFWLVIDKGHHFTISKYYFGLEIKGLKTKKRNYLKNIFEHIWEEGPLNVIP